MYSKIRGMPAIDNFDGGITGRHRDKNQTIKVIDKQYIEGIFKEAQQRYGGS